MFQCHSPKSSHPLPHPQSSKDCSIQSGKNPEGLRHSSREFLLHSFFRITDSPRPRLSHRHSPEEGWLQPDLRPLLDKSPAGLGFLYMFPHSPTTRIPKTPGERRGGGRRGLDLAFWEWAGPPRLLPRPILECSPGQQEQPIVGSHTLLPPPRAASSRGTGSDRRIPFSHPHMRSSSLTLAGGGGFTSVPAAAGAEHR